MDEELEALLMKVAEDAIRAYKNAQREARRLNIQVDESELLRNRREQWLLRYHGDKGFRDQVLRANRERRRRKYAEDPAYRAAQLERQRRLYAESPEYRERQKALSKERYARKKEDRKDA